jgi:hypothetical protein
MYGMGNFNYYTLNNTLIITTSTNLFAIAIYGSNKQLSDLTVGTNFEASQKSNGDNTYNLLFSYKPNNIYSSKIFSNKILFTVNNDPDLTQNLVVDWVIDTSNIGNVNQTNMFANPYNTTTIQNNIGYGYGDPHVYPLINPEKCTYILNTNNNIYRYLDIQTENERLIMNCKMIVLSNDDIELLEQKQKQYILKFNNKEINKDDLENALNKKNEKINMKTKDYSKLDTSFIRYIYIQYINIKKNINEKILIDMETLNFLNYNMPNIHEKINDWNNTIDTVQNNLSHMKCSNMIKCNYKNLCENTIEYCKNYFEKKNINININNTIVNICFKIYLLRPNYRNYISVQIAEQELLNKSFGILININHKMILSNILCDADSIINSNEHIMKLCEYKKMRKKILRKKIKKN